MEYRTNSLVGIFLSTKIFINVYKKLIYDFSSLRVLNKFKKIKL